MLCVLGGILNSLYNVVVTGTTTEVALQGFSDFFFGWMGIAIQKIGRRHDHSRGTKTALQAVGLFKSFLKRMKGAVLGEALNGGHFAAVRLDGQKRAGFYGFAIDQYGTGSTIAGVTTDMGPGKAKGVAEEMRQQ